MKLANLEARFIRYDRRPDGTFIPDVDAIADAQGVMFLCPKCFVTNGGRVGTHRVLCWSRSRGVPEDATPGPGRWQMVGTGIDDLTLNGDAPGKPGDGARSVQLTGDGCGWHGFITDGEAIDA